MAYKAEHYCEDDMCSVKYSGINAILSSNWTLSCKLFSQVKMEIINRYLCNFQEKVEEEYFLWKGFSHVCSMSQITATEWKTEWILKEKKTLLTACTTYWQQLHKTIFRTLCTHPSVKEWQHFDALHAEDQYSVHQDGQLPMQAH